MTALQQTLVVPLLPTLPRLLDTSADNASWLVTATLLTGAVATPVVSRLADMFGKRLLMTVCLVVMVAGSLVGALSDSLVPGIVARAMQGVGVALVPVAIAVMRDELPARRVPLAVGLMSATLAIGAGAGLPLSGLMTQFFDWHAIFWVTAAAGAVMLVAVPLVLSQSPTRSRGAFDYRGAVLLSMALTASLLVLSKGEHWGWASQRTVLIAVSGVLLLLVWIPLQLHTSTPLVDVRTAARPAALLVNVAGLLLGFGMFANLLTTTQLLQLPKSTGFGQGLDLVHTGLWMTPSALVFGLMAPVSAAITHRFGAQTTLLIGALEMAGTYVARPFFSHELWQVVTGSALVGMGTSLAFAAMPILIMRTVPRGETASANGLNTLVRSIGMATASAAVAALTTGAPLDSAAGVGLAAMTAVFWLAATLCGLAAALALLLFWIATEGRRDAPPDEPAVHSPRGHGPIAAPRSRVPLNRPEGQARWRGV